MLTVLLPVTRPWARIPVCNALAASDIPRGRLILVLDAPGCEAWEQSLTDIGFDVETHATNAERLPDGRLERRESHNTMREFTVGLVPDGPLLCLDDDSIVPLDVYVRLSSAGPHATGVQRGRWATSTHCGVYRGGRPLKLGHGIEPVEQCGHYCLLTTGEMYRRTALHGPHECHMQPIPGLVCDWGCIVGHLTEGGVIWPKIGSHGGRRRR